MSSETESGFRAIPNTSLTAAGSGDNTAIVGPTIDRDAFLSPQKCTVFINWKAVLAATKLLTFKSVFLESSDASDMSGATTFATFENSTGTAVATDSGAGSTLTGCKRYGVHLGPAKRYMRLNMTPDLNASGTDTAEVSAVIALEQMYKGPAL